MKLYNLLKGAVALALTGLVGASVADAEKFPPNIQAWDYRVDDFFQYSVRSPLTLNPDGTLALQPNGNPVGALINPATGRPYPIQSIDNRLPAVGLPAAGDPTPMDAGVPVLLDVYFDKFSNEFQLQIAFAADAQGQFPSSMAFVVTEGTFPDTAAENDQWAMFHVDATRTQLDAGGFQLPGSANRPVLTVCNFQPTIANPLTESCVGQTPVLSSLRASDQTYLTGAWPTGLEKFKRIEIVQYTHWLLQVPVREFTINIDATPILNAFNAAGAPGMGLQGTNIDLNDITAMPNIGLRLAAYYGAEYAYDPISAAMTGFIINGPEFLGQFRQTHLQLVQVPVTSRCPINCIGDIWGTVGPNGECAPTPPTPPTPPTDPNNPNPPTSPVCTKQEFTDNLFALDGGAAGLNALVKFSTQRVQRNSRGLNNGRQYVLAAKKNAAGAEAAFIQAWTLSWSFPQVMIACRQGTIPADCQVNDLTAQAASYLNASTQVRDFSLSNVRQLSRIRRVSISRSKKKQLRELINSLRRQTEERYQESVDLSKEIPVSSVQCTSTQL
jgi:hypothetical protein